LNGGRFEVKTTWKTSDGKSGDGQAVALTPDTGYFWFFSPSNVEMVVKVVSGCGFNSRAWVFAGGLTNVNAVMNVRDTVTGAVKTYTNPQGTAFQPIQDTDAFAACSTSPGGGDETEAGTAASVEPQIGSAACVADAKTLCLNGGRFRVQTTWKTADGKSGDGQAVALTSDTGYFWFFSPSNVEMVVKVVAGCGFNSRYWVFAGGLTNVAVTMTVTDTQTGAVKVYANPQGAAFQPIQDTDAFPCP